MQFKQLIKNAGTHKGFDRWCDGMVEANSVSNRRCKSRRSWKRLASKTVRRNNRRIIKEEGVDYFDKAY